MTGCGRAPRSKGACRSLRSSGDTLSWRRQADELDVTLEREPPCENGVALALAEMTCDGLELARAVYGQGNDEGIALEGGEARTEFSTEHASDVVGNAPLEDRKKVLFRHASCRVGGGAVIGVTGDTTRFENDEEVDRAMRRSTSSAS